MCRKWLAALAFVALAACTREVATQTAKDVKESTRQAAKSVGDAFEADADYSPKPDDRAAREKERFDAQWRQLQYFREQQAEKAALQQQQQQQTATQPAAAQPANFHFVTGVTENWKVVDPNAVNNAPVAVPL